MNKNSVYFLAAFVFLLCACERRPVPPVVETGSAIAKIDDQVITDVELLERVKKIEKTFPRIYSTHEQKKKLLNEMINIELLYREALNLNFQNQYDFKSRMADLYVQTLAERARNEIGEAELKKYFEENKEAIQQISARHILVKFPSKMSSQTKQELKKKIEEIRKEVVAAPDSFGGVAFLKSDDSSRTTKGDLGFFTRSMMVKPFSEAAFSLKKVGDISPIIETEFGYHVIQLTGLRKDFDQFKDQIKEVLLRANQKSWLDQEIARLRNPKKIQIYEDNLAKLSPLPKEVTTDPAILIPEKETPEKPSAP